MFRKMNNKTIIIILIVIFIFTLTYDRIINLFKFKEGQENNNDTETDEKAQLEKEIKELKDNFISVTEKGDSKEKTLKEFMTKERCGKLISFAEKMKKLMKMHLDAAKKEKDTNENYKKQAIQAIEYGGYISYFLDNLKNEGDCDLIDTLFSTGNSNMQGSDLLGETKDKKSKMFSKGISFF